jgi:O-antigen/teichoic acid export membrane protein
MAASPPVAAAAVGWPEGQSVDAEFGAAPQASANPRANPFAAGKLLGRSAQSVVAALMQAGGAAVFGLVLPLVLAPAEYGDYVYLLWLAAVVTQIGSFGLPQAAQRFIPAATPAEQQSISRLLMRLPFASGLLGAAIVGCWFLLAPARSLSAGQIALCAALVIPAECVLIWAAVLRGSMRFAAITVGEIVGLTTKCVLLAIIVLRAGRATLLLLVAAEAAAVALQALWLWCRNTAVRGSVPAAALDRGLRRAILQYALGVWSIALIDNLLWRVEIAFLHGFASARAAAIFNVTNQVTQAAVLLPCAAITALFPSFAGLSARRNGDTGTLYRTATTVIWAATLPFYFLATTGGRLLLLVYGARYRETLALLPLLMVGRTLVVAACASSTVLCAIGAQRRLLGVVAAGAALNLAGNTLLVPRFGLWGAVTGACVFQPAVSLATIWLAHRAVGGGFPLNRLTAVFSVTTLYLAALAYMYRYWGAVALMIVLGAAVVGFDRHVRQSFQTIKGLLRARAGLPATAPFPLPDER